MNLVVDIGNSFLKIYIFEEGQLIHFQQNRISERLRNPEYFYEMKSLSGAIVSSVSTVPGALIRLFKDLKINYLILDHNTPLPIKNLYKTPETLGKDRLAAVVGAYNIYTQHNVLAVDAGTALTFDFINYKGEYLGGNISPGLEMRFRALNFFTKKLPLLEKADEVHLIGTNTREAIIAGVQNGIAYEIDMYIDKLRELYTDLKVILTGGDTFFFEHKLKNTIFAEPNLVAIGLNNILRYNVENCK